MKLNYVKNMIKARSSNIKVSLKLILRQSVDTETQENKEKGGKGLKENQEKPKHQTSNLCLASSL